MGEGREHFYDAAEMKDIADTVVKYAEGVFLWVRLVVEELRKGQDDGDRIEELYAKLMRLPKTLSGKKGLYMRMIDMSPSRNEATKLFQLVLASQDPLYLDELFYAADELYQRDDSTKIVFGAQEIPTASSETGTDRPLLAVTEEVKFLTSDQIQRKLGQWEKRLKSRCMGLLEVPHASRKVQFMHATCKEFVREYLERDSSTERLEPAQVMLRTLSAIVTKLKKHDFSTRSERDSSQTHSLGSFTEMILKIRFAAQGIEWAHDPAADCYYFSLMEEVRRLFDNRGLKEPNKISHTFDVYLETWNARITPSGISLDAWDFFSLWALLMPDGSYTLMSLQRNGIDPKTGAKLLGVIIRFADLVSYSTAEVASRWEHTVQQLFSHNVDPHMRIGTLPLAMSAWGTLLHVAYCRKQAGSSLSFFESIMKAISESDKKISAKDRVYFLGYTGLRKLKLSPLWEGSLRQVLSGVLGLPEYVVTPIIGYEDPAYRVVPDPVPSLPAPEKWKVEVVFSQEATS